MSHPTDKNTRNIAIPSELYTRFGGRANMVHFLEHGEDTFNRLEALANRRIEELEEDYQETASALEFYRAENLKNKKKVSLATKALKVYSEGTSNDYAIDYKKMVSGKEVSVTKSFRAYSELAMKTLNEL